MRTVCPQPPCRAGSAAWASTGPDRARGPNGSERIPFLPDDELEALYTRAEQLLRVSKDLQDGDELLTALRDAVAAEFDADGPDVTPVGYMPTATSRAGDGLRASGTEAILGPLAAGSPTFELRPDTLVRRVLLDDGAAVGAELLDRVSGAAYEVRARRVVVCGDSLRTPQLLFASGMRPRALGHYLNDHFQMTALVNLNDEFVRDMPAPGEPAATGSVLIPFSSGRPMQGQVVTLSRTGYRIPLGADSSPIPLGQIGILAWYAAKDVQYRDAVEFSETERDFYGMPAMTIRYTITDVDRETLALQRAPTSNVPPRWWASCSPNRPSLRAVPRSTTRAPSAWASPTTASRCAIPTPVCGVSTTSTSVGTG